MLEIFLLHLWVILLFLCELLVVGKYITLVGVITLKKIYYSCGPIPNPLGYENYKYQYRTWGPIPTLLLQIIHTNPLMKNNPHNRETFSSTIAKICPTQKPVFELSLIGIHETF